MKNKTFFLALSCILIQSLSFLQAHTLGQSYIFLTITENDISGRFELNIEDLNTAFNTAYPDSNVVIDKSNLVNYIDWIRLYYQERVTFSGNGSPYNIQFGQADILEIEIATYLDMKFELNGIGEKIPDALDIDYNVLFDANADHQGLVVIETFWRANLFNNGRIVSLVLNKDDNNQSLELANFSIFTGIWGVTKLGIKHILIGIDHILFLVALILPSVMFRRSREWEPVTEFKPALFYVIKIVTLFTIAHSVTLSLAALGILELNIQMVESIIALSIAVAALDILIPIFKGRIGLIVFVFGLFHGFGFASVLSHLGVLGDHMVLSLLSFNLGVELGQVAVICAIFPILYLIRNQSFYKGIIMRVGAVLLILIAMYWFVERAFGL